MQQLRDVPLDNKSIKVVDNLKDFCNESFGPEANVILFRRKLSMDFNAAAEDLQKIFALHSRDFMGNTHLDESELENALLQASDETKKALGIILDDMRSLKEKWGRIRLRVIGPSDGSEEYHTDGTTNASLGRVSCSYNTPTTEGLLPEETGKNEKRFLVAKRGTEPFSFRAGDMWRGACSGGKGAKVNVSPFVHRAPRSNGVRLLLVADPL